jgi:sucrose-6-phosphate hydrolase SacC (GH32 family)
MLTVLSVAGLGRAADHAYTEPYRPQFHFTAAKNWLNDPNGLVYYKGEYHLFFQHNPSDIKWGNMTWGHAVSSDLVHWRQLDHALLPDKLGTMFSGSAVVDWDNTAGFQKGDEKTLVALYTAAGGTSPESKGQPFTQCLAYSNDRGKTWTKYDKNPVLGHIVKENRDPKVVWHAPTKHWIMALYKDANDFALFSSPDLKSWTHLQDISIPGRSECPDFFEMPVDGDAKNTRWVMTAADGHYMVGTFDGHKFTPQAGPLQADWGGNYYAVQTYSDTPDGRRIQIAWMAGGKYPEMPFNQQMGFPCEMKLKSFADGLRLTRLPVKEIETLRGTEHKWADVDLQQGKNPLADIRGDLFDITVEFKATTAREFGLKIRGETLKYTPVDKKLTCLGKSAEVEPVAGKLTLRVLVDRASIEVYANDGRVVMTSCFVPKLEDHSLGIYVEGGPVAVPSLVVHELRSAWAAGPATVGVPGTQPR